MWSLHNACCIVFIRWEYLLAKVSVAPTELNLLLSVYPQGSISGFALISPWAMQECRPFRALCRISLYVLGCVNRLLRLCFCI